MADEQKVYRVKFWFMGQWIEWKRCGHVVNDALRVISAAIKMEYPGWKGSIMIEEDRE